VWRRSKDDSLLDLARAWAEDLLDDGKVRTSIGEYAYGPGYMTGLAGIGRFFLRLADPAGLDLPFMVAGVADRPDPLYGKIREINGKMLRPTPEARAEVAKLSEAGPAAFAAVCRLFVEGESNWMTHELVRAVWTPGAEKRLLELADDPKLIPVQRWGVLKEVREYLLARLERETDAGYFFSIAAALALLGESRGTETVAKTLLEFRDGWHGVAPNLIGSLATLGGKKATPTLRKYLEDGRATEEIPVTAALGALGRIDPAEAKKAAKALVDSDRFAGFPARLQARIEAAAR
jgi:hypothetical protein